MKKTEIGTPYNYTQILKEKIGSVIGETDDLRTALDECGRLLGTVGRVLPATVEPVELTAKEFDLLAFLATDIGAVRTRTEILENVWDAHWYGPTKTVDAHVASLRKKLGGHEWIQAVRGVGFRLEPPA